MSNDEVATYHSDDNPKYASMAAKDVDLEYFVHTGVLAKYSTSQKPPASPEKSGKRGVRQRIGTRLVNEWHIDNLDFDHTTQAVGILDWRTCFGHDSNRCIRSRSTQLALRLSLFLSMFIIW